MNFRSHRKSRIGTKLKLYNQFTKIILCLAALSLVPVARGQIFSIIKNFSAASYPNYTNSDGGFPEAGLALSGSTLYGTTYQAGTAGVGTVFKVNTDGSGYTVLKTFTNSPDGAHPYDSLTLSGNVLYGTTEQGGSSGNGTVFQINSDGSGYSVLYNFSATTGSGGYGGTNGDGAYPDAGLTLSGSTLYGTTQKGGGAGLGTIFMVNTNGSGYTVLHSFSGNPGDGAGPRAGLALSGSTLYGTTPQGGSLNWGTVFKVNTDGSGYTVLYNFAGYNANDGSNPQAGLTLSGSTLYGTTYQGGSGYGTVFRINTNGTGYTLLKNFAGYPSEGANPQGVLTLSGNTLYDTTFQGGSIGYGTVFQINTDGTGYAVLKNFTNSPDARQPYAGLILSGSTLYGTTSSGGNTLWGTVFSLTLQSVSPLLGIAIYSNSPVVFFPTSSGTNFNLQMATNLSSPVWVGVTNVVPFSGYQITNPPANAFFRLH